MKQPRCFICEKPLEGGEILLCTSCHIFFSWKYGKKRIRARGDDLE